MCSWFTCDEVDPPAVGVILGGRQKEVHVHSAIARRKLENK